MVEEAGDSHPVAENATRVGQPGLQPLRARRRTKESSHFSQKRREVGHPSFDELHGSFAGIRMTD